MRLGEAMNPQTVTRVHLFLQKSAQAKEIAQHKCWVRFADAADGVQKVISVL